MGKDNRNPPSRQHVERLARQLKRWFAAHARELPWRKTSDPYRILVSEIMLQQTRVETVLRYYDRFLERYPEARALADAPAQDVLKQWEGLGYYRRARTLQAAAARIAETGAPITEEGWRELPGIGPYTAAAVHVFSRAGSGAPVDGNVERVLCRLSGIDLPPGAKRMQRVRTLAAAMLPSDAWTQGQALMELGATVCTPRAPRCPECPWRTSCRAFADGRQDALPRTAKRAPLPLLAGDIHWVLRGDRVLLRPRPTDGLWGGLWEPPGIHVLAPGRSGGAPDDMPPALPAAAGELDPIRHLFSHFRIELRAFLHVPPPHWRAPRPWRWHNLDALPPLPAPFARSLGKVAAGRRGAVKSPRRGHGRTA